MQKVILGQGAHILNHPSSMGGMTVLKATGSYAHGAIELGGGTAVMSRRKND